MPWVLVDVALGVLALLLLGLVLYRLYRRVRVLMRSVGASSETIGELTGGLTVVPPPPASPREVG